MARKLELSVEQANILILRVELARALGIFTVRDLTANWGISIRSVYRYRFPEHRENSREYARKAYLSYRKSLARGVCYKCQDSLTDHARCPSCTILLHTGAPTCGASYCIGSRIKGTIEHTLSPYEQAIEQIA